MPAIINSLLPVSILVFPQSERTNPKRVRLTPGPLQATLSKLLTSYCVLRPTQPPTLSGTGNEQ